MEHMTSKFESPEELFLKKLKLVPGTRIKFIKRAILTSSELPVGTEIEGILRNEVKIGKPVYFTDTNQVVSNISAVGQKNGGIFFKTDTSVYQLITTPEPIEIKTLTMVDWKKELEIHIKKGYGDWDVMNNRVPPEDDPTNLMMKNSGLNPGDQVIYFSDGKERLGTLLKDGTGFSILDTKGDKNGIVAILNDLNGWIRKV